MRKTSKILSLLLTIAIIMSLLPAIEVSAVNPYLPLWEHLPDGEPKVFEDPDNPGKYRAYIFGSHDVRYNSYCGPDIRAWSAPVEDLTNWRDEGSVFKYYINGQWDVFYAPDVVEVRRKDGTKEYYLYPHCRGSNRIAMVCKSDRPAGPYTPINMTADGTRTVSGSILGFDPAVWIEYITDPEDPDYEIGFRAYAYWGYAGSNEKSWVCELDQNTMYSVRPGTQAIQYFIPCSSSYGNINDPAGTTYPYIYPDEDITSFNFFEASSIRKIGNKYIMIYSGYSGPDYGLGSTNSALRYAYGDTPLGPWRSGGVLVDSRAPVVNQNGSALTTSNSAHNTHGSLLEINGNWYVFYHRPPRGYGYARQPMVAPVKITWDEKPVAEGGKVVIRAFDPYSEDNTWTAKDSRGYEYTGAEVTSEGFEVFGLDPYKYYSAGYACYFSNPNTLQDSFDIWDNNMPITNVQNGHIIGYKYFGFGGLDAETASKWGLKPFEGTKEGNNTKFNLFLTPRTSNAFKINVWMDGPWANDTWKGVKIGEINVPAGSPQEVSKFSVDVSQFVDNLDKKHAIFLVAEGGSGNLFDLIGLGFSSDTKDIEYIAPPKVDIFVEGIQLTLPTTPVRSTNANGICDYDLYELSYQYPYYSSKPLKVTASASDENIGITITQPTAPNGVAEVKFDKDGVVKTYRINLSVNTDVLTTAYIDDITVNGESIPNFSKSRFNYSVEVPAGTTTVPDIKAVSSDEAIKIEVINELETIPGVKVFRSFNEETNAEVIYRVGVGYKPVSTEFKEGETAALNKGWYFNAKNDNASFGEAGLTITTERGAFSNPEAQPKNVFMLPAAGDWVVQSKAKFNPTPAESNQQAGLIIYEDDSNYIRFVYERPTSGSSNVLRVYNVANGAQTQSNSATLASLTELYFQIVKQGERYTFMYSQDGVNWTTFGTSITAQYALPQIGLFANNGDTEAAPINVTYEKLSVYDLSELYPRLSTILIDGEPLAGFDPEVFNYSVAVDQGETNVPVITATCSNPEYNITYNQLTTPTGKATVTVSSPIASTTYTINFNSVPVSDYFADGTMNSNWTVLRENKNAYSIEKGFGLRLPTQRYDIYGTGAAWENVFIQPALGDWEVVAKVFYPHVPTANYQQAMLLVWQDEDNYIRANCQQSSLRYEPGIETNGSFSATGSGNATAAEDGTVTLYHRIKKEGNTYTISVSQDGLNFTQLGNPITANYTDPKIGLFATQNSDSTPMNTYIEYLAVTSINGVQQMTYQEMLQNAANNVMKYVSEDIPAVISSDIEFAPVPHGYSVSVECSDPDVISADGKVTRPLTDKEVTLTVIVTDGARTSVSEPITVTVRGLQPVAILTGNDNVEPASEFTVGISIDTASKDVYAEDIILSFDPQVFEYVNATSADENINILRSETSDGTVRIIAANIGGVNGSDVPVLNVNFKVKSGVQGISSTISLIKAKLGLMPEATAVNAGLSSKTITVSSIIPSVDKSALQAAITAAETLYDSAVVGIENGNYWQADKDAFKAAIDTAKAVYEDPDATQSEVDDAVAALNAAKAAFEASVITPTTGDLNNSSTIDVGDLAIVAYYYGKASTDEDWAVAKVADINKDNKVDIEDLAFIAARILN